MAKVRSNSSSMRTAAGRHDARSKERLRSIFRAAPVGIGMVIDRVIVEANQLLCKMTGYAKEELIGRSARIFYPTDEDYNFVGSEKYRQIAEHGIGSVETCWRRKDGKIIDVLLSSAPLDPSDLSLGVSFTALDISERKTMEENLRASHERLAIAQAAANAGVWDWDMVTGKLLWSDELLALFGMSRAQEPSFDAWLGILHPEDREPAMRRIQKAIDEHLPLENEYRIIDPEGKERWISALGKTYYDDAGKPLRMTGISLEITERKRMEQEIMRSRDELEHRVRERTAELRESEETSRAHLAEIEAYYDLAPLGLCALDRDLRYVRINRRLADLNAMSPEAHLGKTVRQVIPWLADRFEEQARRVLTSGEAVLDVEMTTGNVEAGVARHWRSLLFPIRNAASEITGIGVVLEETTEQKRLEEQLRQSHKMEAIGTLAGGIAHDFNNILAAILGNAELAIEDVESGSSVSKNLHQIIGSSIRARDLVRQILTFSRSSEQKRGPMHLTPLVEETFQLLRASMPATIEMRLNVSLPNDVICANEGQVQHILMNLATNAKQATAGQGLIEISLLDASLLDGAAAGDAPAGNYILMAVRDTGSGVDESIRTRIFEPFFTTRRTGQGTGLGLSVVHGIVANHNGFITVESSSGKGATFRVFLPKAKVVVQSIGETDEDLPRGKERILFVDDEEELCLVAAQRLARLGYEVTTAFSGEEALQLFVDASEGFDLVITDQTMPAMTGIDLSSELLRIRPALPIIICTGYSERINESVAEEIGIAEFLMKPIVKRKLALTVRRLLDGRKANQQRWDDKRKRDRQAR